MLKIITSTEKQYSPSYCTFQIPHVDPFNPLVLASLVPHQALNLSKASLMSSISIPWLFFPIFFFLPLVHTLLPITTTTCRDTCGSIPVKYPFGTGSGCGHPNFTRYVKCSSGILQFATPTGIYTISSIDYDSNSLVITDPLMSNCSSMQNSGSFSLDSAAPFSIITENTFVLLGCSTSSPVFDPNEDFCDTGSASHVCRGMYSCKGVTGIGLEPNAPISTCCVYNSPIGGLGSGYAIDLPKLQCSTYTAIYGFGDNEGDPMGWNYGILLHFNESYQTDSCKDCEASGGTCGFAGLDVSFACICRNGVNSTLNCYGQGFVWSATWRPNIQIKMSIQVSDMVGLLTKADVRLMNFVNLFSKLFNWSLRVHRSVMLQGRFSSEFGG
ncbi:hypothetical protein HHK36_007350 [Tetracentron sinense]|uniref:Wall-associated receptor kinase galacturonan-binding domain-containing protein n=1 Tax=Tetracentron sinense TaxID=13715 RepID=A0A834ZJM8_TETSI|nr:hypothetical protein HHK36_007350 [Tetracentron sinense]